MTQNPELVEHVHSLFLQNPAGDLTQVNDWRRERQAPLFYLGRPEKGDGEPICLFHESIPALVREEILEKVKAEPQRSDLIPESADQLAIILSEVTEISEPWFGPAFCFNPMPLTGSSDEIILVTEQNANMLEAHLSDWLPDVSYEQPMFAWVEQGEAVGVCASVRTSSHAMAAGVDVCEHARRRGIGRQLVKAWGQAVQDLGKIAMYSTSFDNIASQNLAKSLGLKYLGTDFHISARVKT